MFWGCFFSINTRFLVFLYFCRYETKFINTLKRYDEFGIPSYAMKSEFFLKCQDVKDYIRHHHTLPILLIEQNAL